MANNSIEEQLQELAQFKTLISMALQDMGVVVPDTGFKPWYKAVRDALQITNGYKPSAEVSHNVSPIIKPTAQVDYGPIAPTVTVVVEKV